MDYALHRELAGQIFSFSDVKINYFGYRFASKAAI